MPVRTAAAGRHVVEFQLRGLRVHRRCPPGTTKAEAQALESKLRHEIFATRDLGLEPTIDLPGAIALCLKETAKGTTADRPRELHAHALVDYVIGKTLYDIPQVAEDYRGDALAAGLAPATVNARLNVLKKVAKWAWREPRRWTRENLSAHVALEDPRNWRQRYESLATLRRLAKAMETQEGRAWVALAAGTGLRASELHRLQPGHVRDGVLHLGKTKNGKPRLVPVATFALPYLRTLPFTLTRNQLDQEWRRARIAAGVADFRFHDVRHSYASLLANQGVPLEVVGELLGNHPLTTRRYAHLYESTLRAAVRKLG